MRVRFGIADTAMTLLRIQETSQWYLSCDAGDKDVFRSALIDAYRGRCAISGCDAEPALEACHIRPYRGPQTNMASNGLLLRADLDTLFDLGLVAVDTLSMTCLIATELQDTTYVELAGKPVAVPATRAEDSNLVALDWHRRWSGLFGRGKFH